MQIFNSKLSFLFVILFTDFLGAHASHVMAANSTIPPDSTDSSFTPESEPKSYVICPKGKICDAGDGLYFMVSIQYPVEPEGWEHKCGGSLISERVILTAAHCLFTKSGQRLSTERIRIKGAHPDLLSDQTKTLTINQYLIHPAYRHVRPHSHDIALLFLTTAEPLDGKWGTIRLPDSPESEANASSSQLIVAGWGWTRQMVAREQQDTDIPLLQRTEVVVITRQQCEDYRHNSGDFQFNATLEVICTSSDPADICYGDSGGPLYEELMDTHADPSAYRIHGVTSLASHNVCAYPEGASVFTRVASYLEFINQHLSVAANSSASKA